MTFPFPIVTPASQPKVIFLKTGETWVVPKDWNNASNSIECIGGGAGGRSAANFLGGAGGGGGAYARKNNVTLTRGATVHYRVGQGGAENSPGGDTWFGSVDLANAIVAAKGAPDRIGGSAADSIGDVKFSGGNGGEVLDASLGGGGGGGAAGPNGAGANGGSGNVTIFIAGVGGGGGGANGGENAPNATSSHRTTSRGGHNRNGYGGGSAEQRDGQDGGGGAGVSIGSPGKGSPDPIWRQTIDHEIAGPAGGGGGCGEGETGGGVLPGGYGGGGGGGGLGSDGGGEGAPGLIVITYIPE